MSLLDHSFVIWLNRPYFDLGLFHGSSLHVYGIEFSYCNLVETASIDQYETITNPVTIIHPIYFREELIRETGLYQYQVENPLQLPDELRTERWNSLCNYLTHYQDLQPVIKLQVMDLLSTLCLHQAVLDYIPEMPGSDIASSSTLAKLALCRAMSSLMVQSHNDTLNNLQEFEKISNHASLGSIARFSATIELVASYAKRFRNLEGAEFWRSVATQELDSLKASLDDFSYNLLTSIYYRAVVLIPLLQRDKQTVVREMDLCESLAESLTRECKNEIEQLAAHENLTTVFESRTKEALWLGDIDLAEERARKMVQMEPLW